MTQSITVSEWLSELEKVMSASRQEDDGFLTTREIAQKKFGCIEPNESQLKRVRNALRELQALGRLEYKQSARQGLAGTSSRATYRLKQESAQ